LKEIIDKAFLKHENSIMQKIRFNLQNFSPCEESNMNSCLRNECLELIKKELKDVPDCNNQSNANNREECKKISEERIELDEYLGNKNNVKCEKETKDTIKDYIKLNHQSASTKLNRMVETKFILSESLDIINKYLEKVPKHKLNKRKKVREIWNLLRDHISSKDNVIPVVKQIDNEVKYVYSLLPLEFKNQYQDGIFPDLSKCKACKSFRKISFSRCLGVI